MTSAEPAGARRGEGPWWRDAIAGMAAGAAATGAMTLAMVAGQAVSRGPLAPKQVTGWAVAKIPGLDIREPALTALTLLNHLAYGSALGSLYALANRRREASPWTGVGYGIVVWAADYAGLLPALGVLPPPQRDDHGHAVRIHVAHWVYGATLGAVLARR